MYDQKNFFPIPITAPNEDKSVSSARAGDVVKHNKPIQVP